MSDYLTIFAAEWECALRLKLRRIEESRSQADLKDTVYLLKEIDTCYGCVNKDYFRRFMTSESRLGLVLQTYEAEYGKTIQ